MYLGSKSRIAKHILPTMINMRKEGQAWVEPFVGGANMIDKVGGDYGLYQNVRIGNDINKYLIALLREVQMGWVPPTDISREVFNDVRNRKHVYNDEFVGFVGFMCSFGSKFMSSYANNNTDIGNRALGGSRSLVKQAKRLKGIDFECGDYRDLDIPTDSLIYCDPPYGGMTKYHNDFDTKMFWQWCRDKAIEGHTVFISEYRAPEDFECIQSVDTKTVLNKNMPARRIEKLFMLKGSIK